MTWVNENGAAGGDLLRLLVVEPGPALYRETLFGGLCRLPDTRVSFATAMGASSRWASKYCPRAIDFHYGDDGLRQAVELYARKTGERFDGVLTYTEAAVHYTNELSHALGLPIISRFRDRSIRNKGLAREKLSRVTDAQPWFRRVRNEMELRVLLSEELRFPLIVKPAEMMRGLAAVCVTNKIQLKAAYYRATHADFWNDKIRPHFVDISEEVLVEEFIEGPEYGVEVLVQHGSATVMGITKKYLTTGNCFEDRGHLFPAPDVSPKLRAEVEDLMRKVHAGLMIENSLTNAEVRVRNGKLFLLEINCRVTDDRVSDLIERSYGVSLARILADLHCGRAVQWRPPKEHVTPYEIRFLSTPKEGRVISLAKPRLPEEVEYHNHLSCGAFLHRGGLEGESRLGHAIFPMGRCEVSNELWAGSIQPPLHWENSCEGEPLFLFEALYSDLPSIVELQKKSRGFGELATLRRRHALNPSSIVFVASAERREVLGAAQLLPLSLSPLEPDLNWRRYAELSVDAAHFRTLGKPNTQYVLDMLVGDAAPADTRSILTRGLARWAASQGCRSLRYALRPAGFKKTDKRLRSFKDYYEGLLSRKYPEEFYKVALETGGIAKGFVKDYFDDPPSFYYGVIIEHDLRRLPNH